tara:strand:+ start:624 stop:944 length:321 start_codon:yes stop_codon:yes gene_type:complete
VITKDSLPVPILENTGKSKDIFQAFNVQGRKNFLEKPPLCPLCGSNEMGAVELLGVKQGPFFWECEKCNSRFLRYPFRDTKKFLMESEELWYDLEKLDTIWLELPN